jgi:hypothetical protein
MDAPCSADQEFQRRKLLLVFYDADGSIAFEDRIGNMVDRTDTAHNSEARRIDGDKFSLALQAGDLFSNIDRHFEEETEINYCGHRRTRAGEAQEPLISYSP